MESKTATCQCICGAQLFVVRLERDEQVGLLTCPAGHYSLLLDSRDYWADVLQEGRPKQVRCRCGGSLFRVDLVYDLRTDGDVRCVDVLLNCRGCGQENAGTSFEIDYSPTTELLSRPLDSIEQPWLRAKRCQITSYWQPADAERFASYLTSGLNARIYRAAQSMEECRIESIDFHPELRYDLYFTSISGVNPAPSRDPQNIGPFLRLASPFHIACPGGIALLHYIEYADEILRGAEITPQPDAFLSFARQARDWLKTNYLSKRGRNTADNPTEYQRIVSLLR